jgi:hypothetical protein
VTRRLPPPWRAEKFSGGYVVRDANSFAVAYVHGRSTEAEALEAKSHQTSPSYRTCRSERNKPYFVRLAWNLPYGSSDAAASSARPLSIKMGVEPLAMCYPS